MLLLAGGLAVLSSMDARRRLRPVAVSLGLLPERHATATYRARLAAFERENGSLPEGCTILLGDSLAEGLPDDLAEPLGIVRRGVSGDRVRDVERRLSVSVLAARCRTVLVLAGTNDLADGAPPERVAAALVAIADRIGSTGRRVILVSVPPTGGAHRDRNPSIVALNERLAAARTEHGFGWIDLGRQVVAADGALDDEMSDDGIHLTRAAYVRFAALISDALAR